jgi:hypothetical protein
MDDYKDYKDLDKDFPDTSNIINDYLGCQATTHDGVNCSLKGSFKTPIGSNGDCSRYCSQHIDKWLNSLKNEYVDFYETKIPLTKIEIIYSSKTNKILIDQAVNKLSYFLSRHSTITVGGTVTENENVSPEFSFDLNEITNILKNEINDIDIKYIKFYYITNLNSDLSQQLQKYNIIRIDRRNNRLLQNKYKDFDIKLFGNEIQLIKEIYNKYDWILERRLKPLLYKIKSKLDNELLENIENIDELVTDIFDNNERTDTDLTATYDYIIKNQLTNIFYTIYDHENMKILFIKKLDPLHT